MNCNINIGSNISVGNNSRFIIYYNISNYEFINEQYIKALRSHSFYKDGVYDIVNSFCCKICNSILRIYSRDNTIVFFPLNAEYSNYPEFCQKLIMKKALQ